MKAPQFPRWRDGVATDGLHGSQRTHCRLITIELAECRRVHKFDEEIAEDPLDCGVRPHAATRPLPSFSRMGRASRLLAAMLSCAIVAACTHSARRSDPARSGSTPTESRSPTGNHLATSSWAPTPSASYMGAPVSGVLAVESDGCIRLHESGPAAGAPITLLWPRGFTQTQNGGDVPRIVSPGGEVVAQVGDPFSTVGGYVHVEAGSQLCITSNDAFEINQVLPKR